MAFRLVTGRAEKDHVTSDDYGVLYSLTKGDGRYKLDDITCKVLDANTIHVSQGNLMIDGRHFRNSKEGENLTLANGAQGRNRIDLVVCRYNFEAFGEDYLEHGTLAVIQGESVIGEPQVPDHVHGSILNGDHLVEVPLFTVPIEGISVGEPSACMLDWYELPAKYGGTGIAVEIVQSVKGAIEDATAAAAAANAAAQRSAEACKGGVTYDVIEQIVAQMVAFHGQYMIVGEAVFIPSAKGSYSGEDVTLYSADFNDATGQISLT